MKENSELFGKFLNRVGNIEVNVDLIEYEEDCIFYVYCPPLDLIGYGSTQTEARASWEIVLEEYFRYTLNKNTLVKDLESRGWCVKEKNSQFKPPTLSWMLQHNEQLGDVYNNHNFQKVSLPISMPSQNAHA
jgi:predicted RNase H-like HicB family nuclease